MTEFLIFKQKTICHAEFISASLSISKTIILANYIEDPEINSG